MYKYYKELENPNDFKIYMSQGILSKDCITTDYNLDIDFYNRFKELFRKLQIIESLILPNVSLKESNKYYAKTGYFLLEPKDDYEYNHIKELNKKLSLDIYEMIEYLSFYLKYIHFYIFVFPDMKDFFKEVEKEINIALKYIDSKRKIIMPTKEAIEIKYPNSWFITPNGYLYNTGEGHKEGSLVYTYNRICEKLNGTQYDMLYKVLIKKDESTTKESRNTRDINNSRNKINGILERGYVSLYDFYNYSNFSSYILKEMILSNGLNDVSFQKNIITLVVGYLAAKDALYNAYRKLDDSLRKQQLAYKIGELCAGDLADILVRFAGFHKIESQRDKTITTSSLYGIRLFKEYLDRGWTLDVIPGIVYDKYFDKVSLIDFNSIFIEKHLDKELAEYHDKGRILIKR